MIREVASVELPVDEKLKIEKFRWLPEGAEDSQSSLRRISIVTGIHGDELEGQYVCYEIGRRIREHRELLTGIVDIYPAMNPFGIDSMMRGIPAFDLDMNRIFPGQIDGDMNEYIASLIIRDVSGSDMVLDIHASNAYLREVPQIRINELHSDWLVPYAKKTGVDLIWVHPNATVLESTFAYSLNSTGTPVLVAEMGIGMRITQSLGNQLTEGIFNLMKSMGIWKGETHDVKDPVVSTDPDSVCYLNAPRGGIYIADAAAGDIVEEGQVVGRLVSPLTGEVFENVKAPVSGWLFTQREYPLTASGSLMGRILKGVDLCAKK